MPRKPGIADFFRKTAHEAKQSLAEETKSSTSPQARKIFSVLDYIEQPWGLAMRLYPAQRFIVKLYYNLPLDEKLPDDPDDRIKITDMFNTKTLYEFTERDYLTYLYNEGRCNIKEQDHERRELVLAIGRRAGKCHTGDGLVLTDRGIFRIDELGDPEGPEWQSLEVGVAQEAGVRARSAFFYNNGRAKTFKVTSQCGYNIEGTANHRVKVMGSSGEVYWKSLEDIRRGDYLAVNRSTDLWSSEYVNAQSFFPEGWSASSDVVDENLGHLLGLLVGDGSWTHAEYVELTGVESQVRLGSMAFEEALGHPGRCYPATGSKNGWRARYDQTSVGPHAGRLARRFLHDLGWSMDCGRYDKMVPWSILRSPKPVVCAFLRGLFETDGSAESGGRNITFSSASFRLAREVQLLLLNLGIVTNISKKWNQKTKRHYANLSIKGVRSRKLFAQWVGFDSEKKQLPMLEALERAKEGKSDTESVPYQYSHVRALLESVPKRNPAKGELGWGRTHLREALGNTCKPSSGEDLTYTRMTEVLQVARELGAGREEIAHFEELLRLDYFFDSVVSVEEGEDQVYDLNVPDGQMFVANGLTNHNTTLSGIFASYEVYRLLNLYNPQDYYGLPNGNRIQIISVATDKDQAGLLFNEVTSHLAKCQYFQTFIANNTLSHVNFRTPYDIDKFGPTVRQDNGRFVSLNGKATLRVTFKSCIAKGLRGSGNVVVILDEVAHFQDKGQSSAKDIYDAVTPSTAAFSPKSKKGLPIGEVESRIILISSPLGKSGKFFELFDLAMHGGPGSDNLLAIQAPTWEINPTVPASYYKQKYHADPVVFAVEHGAQFSDQVTGWMERESDLLACVSPGLRPKISAPARMPHQMGIDVGLVDDGTAAVITHVENGRIILDYHEAWYAGIDWRETNPHLDGAFSTPYARTISNVERLDFDEIAEWIAVLSKKFHISDGLFDRWNGIPLEQALHKKGLRQFKTEFFTRDQNSKIFQTAKMFIFDEKLVLYDYPCDEGSKKHSPMIQEMLALQARQISKNLVLVEKPKKAGAKDDVSDAFVRSVWLSTQRLLNQKHVSHGAGIYRPHVTSVMTTQRYQAVRRRHGGYTGRMVPRSR